MNKVNSTNSFQPVFRAVSDTFLQIRSRPLMYILVWVTLSLVPYVVMGLLFSAPLSRAFQEFINAAASADEAALNGFSGTLMTASMKILGFSALIQCLLMLIAVYMNDVLAVSVRTFRSRALPGYSAVLSEALPLYLPFLLVVLRVIALVLLQSLGVFVLLALLGYVTRLNFISSIGFFAGFFMFLSMLYRYGLAPFIHLTLNLNGSDSCSLSRQYYEENRHIIASLFLIFFVVPLITGILLLSLFLQMGLYFGMGGMVLWFIQSAFQFVISMSLINFSMEAFPSELDK